MSFLDEPDREQRRKPADDTGARSEPRRSARKRRGEPSQVGDALRSVYERAVEEDIPPEMLDLLGKLG